MLKLIITITMFATTLLCQAQVSEIRKVEHFSRIEVASGIELSYKETQEEASVKIEANEGSLTNIATEVNAETLKIFAIEKSSLMNQTIKVYVSAKDVESFKAVSKSKIIFENTVHAENISIAIESGSYFKGYIKSEKLVDIETCHDTEFHGRIETALFTGNFKNQSKVNLSGNAKEAILKSTGKAYCSARNFLTENTKVDSENSIIIITCKNTININATDNASVTYFGSPKKTNIKDEYLISKKKYIKPSLLAMD